MGRTTMSLFPIRWLFNAINNAIFTGDVNHGVICIKEPQIRIPENQSSYKYTEIQKTHSNITSCFQKIMWNGIFHISDYVCTLKFNIRNHVVSKIANIIVLLEIFEVFSSKNTNIYFINYTNNINLS